MRFAPTSFRPTFGRVLAVLTAIIVALALGGFVVTGDAVGLVRYTWGQLLVVALAFALFWLPRLDVEEHAVTVRNVFSTIVVPWPAIQLVDTKYALTLYTPEGRIAVWASPAPNRYASANAAAGDARLASNGTGAVRPGDLLSTSSGAAAFLIRRHLEQLRDDGRLDAGYEPGSIRRSIHWPTIAVLAGLLVATVLGFVL